MARGQGWELGEEAETDLEQGAETGRQAAWGERRDGADVRTKRQETGRREGGSLGMSRHKHSEPCTHTNNCHHFMQLSLLYILK